MKTFPARPARRSAIVLIIILVLALLMTGCAVDPRIGQVYVPAGQRGQAGAGIGAATGAIIGQAIGHNTEATLIGAAVGTLIGYIFGNEMDKADAQRVAAVAETVPSGQAVSWKNPDNGRQMTAVAGPAYTPPNGGLCRPMTIRGTVPGRRPETARIVVCRRINPSTFEAEWVVQQ